MPLLAQARSLWRNLRRRRTLDEDADRELTAALELLVDEQLRDGVPPEEARRSASAQLSVEPTKERMRDVRAGAWIEAAIQDVRYAWRHLARSPGFATAALLTLALGIGANTAMFSLLNALLVTRLQIDDPDSLLAIVPKNSRGDDRSIPVSAVDVLRDGPLQPLCGYLGGISVPVLANDMPAWGGATFVTGRCFEVFGVRPELGRAISEGDAPIYGAGARVAVISHRLWTSHFGADPAAVGRTLLVNNVEVEIVGVLPAGFTGLEADAGIDIFTPFDSVIPATAGRRQLASFLLGRLKPGTTLAQASAELEARWPALLDAVIPAGLEATQREQLRDSTPRLLKLGTGTSRNRAAYARPVTLIFGLTSVLLVLACVNLGGLLLARLTARSTELSVRLALGGTRWRIAQQMLGESLLLSLAGAALAVPIAYAVSSSLAAFIVPANVPYAMSFTPDRRVLAVTSAVALAVGVLMSALPIWAAVRRGSLQFMAWDRTIVGATSRWVRGLLVAQVALSVVLLVGALLLTRSLYLLQASNQNIRTSDMLIAVLQSKPNSALNRGGRGSYYPPLLDEIAALPGVSAVALADRFPRVTTTPRGMPVTLDDGEPSGVSASTDYVSPQFFTVMDIDVLAGTTFSWADTLETRPVAMISQSLARALASDGDLVGRRLTLRTLPSDLRVEVIGIVADATQGDPRQPRPYVVYRPALQSVATSVFSAGLLIAATDRAVASARHPRGGGVWPRLRVRDCSPPNAAGPRAVWRTHECAGRDVCRFARRGPGLHRRLWRVRLRDAAAASRDWSEDRARRDAGVGGPRCARRRSAPDAAWRGAGPAAGRPGCQIAEHAAVRSVGRRSYDARCRRPFLHRPGRDCRADSRPPVGPCGSGCRPSHGLNAPRGPTPRPKPRMPKGCKATRRGSTPLARARPFHIAGLGDHDLGGLDNRNRVIAAAKLQGVDSVRRDDRRERLITDAHSYLGQQAVHAYFVDKAAQAVPGAETAQRFVIIRMDSPPSALRQLSCKKTVDLGFRDPVVATLGPSRADDAAVHPSLQCGIGHAELIGGHPDRYKSHDTSPPKSC
jgi:predicted permease